MQFDLTGAREALRYAKNVEKQLTFVQRTALNDLAFQVRAAQQHEIKDVFSSPTRGTQNSPLVKRATDSRLQAEVYIQDEQAKGNKPRDWLSAEVRGGQRQLKRFERALQAVGAMPGNTFVVPSKTLKLDAYGNIPSGLIVQLLSYFKAFPENGYKANITDARKAKLRQGSRKKVGYSYFAGRPNRSGKFPEGIWKVTHFAMGDALELVFLFVARARYDAVYDFDYVSEITIRKHADRIFNAALERAIASAH